MASPGAAPQVVRNAAPSIAPSELQADRTPAGEPGGAVLRDAIVTSEPRADRADEGLARGARTTRR